LGIYKKCLTYCFYSDKLYLLSEFKYGRSPSLEGETYTRNRSHLYRCTPFFNRGEIIMENVFFVNIALLLDLLLRL